MSVLTKLSIDNIEHMIYIHTAIMKEIKAYEADITTQVDGNIKRVDDALAQIGDIGNYITSSDVATYYVKKEDGKSLFSGKYSDLVGAPKNISAFTNDSHYMTQDDATTSFVQKVAGKDLFSGKYSDLTGSPTAVSTFNNDAGYAKTTDVDSVYQKKADAFSGKYSDLVGAPTAVSTFTNDAGYIKKVEADMLYQSAGTAFSGKYSDLTGTPSNVSAFNNDAGYAKTADIAQNYVQQSYAAGTYLASADAATTYLQKTDAASTYLASTDAANTYLDKASYNTEVNEENTVNAIPMDWWSAQAINPFTSLGVTYTYIPSANSVSCSGISTGNSGFWVLGSGSTFDKCLSGYDNKWFTLSGCPTGGSGNTYKMMAYVVTSTGTVTNYVDTGSGVTFFVPSGSRLSISVLINGTNYTADTTGLSFMPMLRRGKVSSAKLSSGLGVTGLDDLAKRTLVPSEGAIANMLRNDPVSTTKNSLVVTYGSDGSYILNGTPTADTIIPLTNALYQYNTVPDTSGIHSLSGCPTGGALASYYLFLYETSDGSTLTARGSDVGSGANVFLRKDMYYYANIFVSSGTVCNNLVFKPQLEKGPYIHKYVKPVWNNTISGAVSERWRHKEVTVLPTVGEINVVYFISNGNTTGAKYDKYIYHNGNWESLGGSGGASVSYGTTAPTTLAQGQLYAVYTP